MSSVKATQLRPGMVIQHQGDLFTVFTTEHRTPGNKRGSMQTRMKNLRTGAIIEYRFRAEEFVDRAILDEKQRQEVLSLTTDFPRLWRDPNVSHRERKRMVRLLIEDVTLLKGEQISIGVCFRGGATRSLTIPVPLPS